MSSASRLADLALLRFLAPSHPTLSRRVLPVVSAAADRGVLWAGTAAVLAGLGGRRGRRAAVEGMLAVGAASALVNGPLKQVIGRRRPGAGLARFVIAERGRAPSTSSMPSGHATSAAAFAVAAGAAMPVVAAPLAGLAGLVAWSRVSGGRHFPTDVAAGIAAGAAAGLAVHVVAGAIRPIDDGEAATTGG